MSVTERKEQLCVRNAAKGANPFIRSMHAHPLGVRFYIIKGRNEKKVAFPSEKFFKKPLRKLENGGTIETIMGKFAYGF